LGTLAAQEEASRSEERRRILTVLAGKSEGLSVSEIMVAAELRNRNAADILLFKMKEAGEVAHLKRGIYCLLEYAGKIGKKERLDGETTEIKAESDNLSDLSDLSRGTAPPPVGKIGNGTEPNLCAHCHRGGETRRVACAGVEAWVHRQCEDNWLAAFVGNIPDFLDRRGELS
jgi:hypothetical protein